MKKIALLLVLILTVLWLSGCTKRSNPTFNESDMLHDFYQNHETWELRTKDAFINSTIV